MLHGRVSYGCFSCAGKPLCEPCVARWIEIHTGNAEVIGRAWGAGVARRVPPPRPPWPAFDDSELVRAKGVQQIGYLAGPDERCRVALARLCAEEAAAAYAAAVGELQHQETAAPAAAMTSK